MALQKTPLLSEETVNLVITQLKNNFNLYVQDIDNQYKDGISLENVDNTSIYISNQFQTLRTPALFVLLEQHAFQYSKDPNYMESEDRCLVVVTLEDIGADNLTRKAWRYGKALYGCLSLMDLGDTAGRIKIRLVPERLGYTEPIKGKLSEAEKKFRMDVVLELKILHYENFLI